MNENAILEECKSGLGISIDNDDLDRTLNQKIKTVKMFMKGSGVPNEKVESDDAIGTIVLGVTDLWELKSGEIKFSPAFNTLTTQLATG